MKGTYKAGREREFTVGYWKVVGECEFNEQVAIVLTAIHATQVGVITFDLAARGLEREPFSQPLARVTETWPNAREQPFEVFVYQMAIKLSVMVENVRKEQVKAARR